MILALRRPTKAMKKPMPGSRAVLQAIGNVVDDVLADVGERENQKERAGQENDAERRLPRHAAAKNNRVREVRVQRHSGSECNRIIRPQAHHQRGERRRNARCEEHALDRHARFTQDARIHDHHIGHGHERRQAAKKFAANRGVVFREMKNSLEQCVPL